MSENANEITVDHFTYMGEDTDEITIKHPERNADGVVQETTSRRAEEELQDDDESTMSWNFVFGMIFLALIVTMI